MESLFLTNSQHEMISSLEERLFALGEFPLKKRIVVIPHKRAKELLLESFVIRSERICSAGIKFYTLFEMIEYFASLQMKEVIQFPRDGILALYLEEKIHEHLEEESFSPLRNYLDGDLSKIGDLARGLSKTFKNYDLYGGEALSHWLKESGWQQLLWKEAFALWPFFTKLSFGKSPVVPAELHIFGLSHIPNTVKRLLEGIEKVWSTHYYLFSPSEYYWGDLSTDRKRLSLQKYFTKKGVRQEECDELDLYARNRNSLLANFGAHSAELFAYFVDRETVIEESYLRADDSLLGAIKNDILDLRNPEEDGLSLQKELSGITLHAAPSKLREVEILYNNILALFAKDPNLSFQDISIFAPKIAPYYPYIQMVFGSPDSLLADYAVSDLPIVLSSKKLQSVEKLFQFISEKGDLFDFFYSDGFLEKFGLADTDIDTWKRWMGGGRIKEEVLDRLVLSLAAPLEEEDPLPSIEPSETPLLETFLSVYTMLSNDMEILKRSQLTIKEWALFLRELVNRYLFSEEDLTPFTNHLNQLSLLQGRSVSFSTIWPYLKEFFQIPSYTFRSSSRFPLFFSDLGEGHITLAKHIFLLGMDEESFPTVRVESPLHEIPNIFEPSPADRDRFGFLTALLSARESLTISYQNIHPQDGKMASPSLTVRQLFDYLDEYYLVEGEVPSKKCSFEHPGVSFHESYFSENRKIKSFSKKDYEFASYHYGKKCQTTTSQKEERALPALWNLKDLSKLHHPLRYYAQTALGIYFSELKAEENCNEEFLLSFLDKYRYKSELGKKEPSFLIEQFKKYTPIQGELFQKMATNELVRDFKKPNAFLKEASWSYEKALTITFHQDCKKLFQKGENHWILPPLLIQDYQIVGSLSNIAPSGLLSFSKSKWKELCRQWPNILMINLLKNTFPLEPKIVFAELEEVEEFFIENPEQELIAFLEYAGMAFQNPAPFVSDWFDLLFKEAEWKKAFADSKDPYIELFQESVIIDPWVSAIRKGYGSLSHKIGHVKA